jgi:hypothetical protein
MPSTFDLPLRYISNLARMSVECEISLIKNRVHTRHYERLESRCSFVVYTIYVVSVVTGLLTSLLPSESLTEIRRALSNHVTI